MRSHCLPAPTTIFSSPERTDAQIWNCSLVNLALRLRSTPQTLQPRSRVATLVPKASSWGSKIDAARAVIKERTEGRVILKVYYGGVQGNAAKMKQKIKIGQLHGGDFTPTDFQDKMPNLNLYGLPFVFDSIDEVNYVRELHGRNACGEGFAEHGYVTFGFAGDFAIILSNNSGSRT